VTNIKFPLNPYSLDGDQIDPAASLSLGAIKIRYPSLDEIRKVAEPLIFEFPFPQNEQALGNEIEELKELEAHREDELTDCNDRCRERRKLSLFLKERACGDGFDQQHKVGGKEIKTGGDLARWFENDTPLLGGWMALNALLRESPKPPTQQAEIWAALNVSIHAAIIAAWHYKWMEPQTRLKPRPSEVDSSLTVLYAKQGQGNFSGVPRHPTYPSGHSTVGGATSGALKHFFKDIPWAAEELDNLADNAGVARMWAGIHYRADHKFGVALGNAVSQLVLQ